MEEERNSNFLDDQSALITSATEKLAELQSLVQEKDSVIKSLHMDLEDQKIRRAQDNIVVETKASKIKEWVSTRLRDLENQNEKLRKQNLKCKEQLQVLQTCEENTKLWRSSLLVSSNEGSLNSASMAESDVLKLGSDDSGNTSDFPVDLQFVNVTHQQKTASVERILSCSTNRDHSIRTETRLYTNPHQIHDSANNKENNHISKRRIDPLATGRLLPHSNPGSPRFQRRISRSKGKLVVNGDSDRAGSLPRNSRLSKSNTARSPSESRRRVVSHSKKPVPKPRKKDSTVVDKSTPNPPIFQAPEMDSATRAYLIGDDILAIERDSLMQNSVTSGVSKVESTLEITDSMCNLMIDRDSLGGDYVNLSEIQAFGLGGRKMDEEQPPKPPAHRSMPNWEKKLYDLAQQCLSTAEEMKGRESVFSIGDMMGRNSDGRITSPRTNSSGSQKMSKESSSSSFTLPVFTTRQGNMARTSGSLSPRKPISDPSTSTDLEPSSSPHPYTSGGSSGFENRSSAESSNKNLQLGSSPSNQTSQATVKPNDGSTDVSKDDWASQLSRNASRTARRSESSSEDDYAVPPDAYGRLSDGLGSPVEVLDMDSSMLEQGDHYLEISHAEKSGYLNQMGDARAKSWKRRWFVLANGELRIYKSKNDQNKQPLSVIPMATVTAVKKLQNKAGNSGFEISFKSGCHSMTAETPSVTLEWIKVLQAAQKVAASHSVIQKAGDPSACVTSGWLTKVKYGHSKHYFAKLIDNQLAFFKTQNAKVPMSQMQIQGTEIDEVVKTSDDSASEEGDGSPYARKQENGEYSIQILTHGQETVYLVLEKREDKERWFYHLKISSKDGAMCGTPFEILIQSLMNQNGDYKSKLWSDRIFISTEETMKSPMLSIESKFEKDAIGLYKSSYLFTTVPMQASAIQYHIDLAQNVLAISLRNEQLQNELLAQLIRLSGSDLIMKIQAWKLLALAVSLFVPTKYAVLWMLRTHLEKWANCFELPQSSLAQYARRAMQRVGENGPRKHHPSKLEAISLLTRNPSEHSLPHSIPVVLPDGNYHVIGFDGSSTIQECLQEICCSKGLRHPLYCGYTLYSDDPFKQDVLHALSPNQKLCDVISHWEQQLKEGKAGKIPTAKIIKLFFKQRFYWPHLASGETQLEKIYRAYTAGDQLQKGHIPVSPELAEELCALLGQMHFGDLKSVESEWFESLISKFYPEKLQQVACKATLRNKLTEHWQDLKGSSQHDCSRVLLGVLRRWPFFGSQVFKCSMRWRNEEAIWLAVNDSGVHLLSSQTSAMNAIASYSYNSILQFGGCREDFMLTISRNANSVDEPSKERLIFAMPKEEILELTLLVKDYIKVRRLLSPPSGVGACGKRSGTTASPRRSPRKKCIVEQKAA